MKKVKPGTRWRHFGGDVGTVLFITNLAATEDFPRSVVVMVSTGELYSVKESIWREEWRLVQ